MSNHLLEAGLPPPTDGRCDVLIIAGEHSGDQHASRVVADLLSEDKDLSICTLGGPALAQSGAQLLFDLTACSVVGLVEVIKHYRFFKRLFEQTIAWIKTYQPKHICFIDYPGFNLRLAQRLYEEGISIQGGGSIGLFYYIGPQIWAWKAKRRFKMAQHLDGLSVIFPFEVDCYQDTTLPVDFVGHPFVHEGYELPVSYSATGPILLLPGSRRQAVRRIFPVLLDAFEAYLHKMPEEKAVVIYPDAAILEVLKEILEAREPSLIDRVVFQYTGDSVEAKAVLTSSGTMSLNCALAGIPGAIVYRANLLTYLLGRMLVNIEYLGIANILLKEPVYPEYIQGAANPQRLVEELDRCVHDPVRIEAAKEDAECLRSILAEESQLSPSRWLMTQMRRCGGL